jgi:hypothetical protein
MDITYVSDIDYAIALFIEEQERHDHELAKSINNAMMSMQAKQNSNINRSNELHIPAMIRTNLASVTLFPDDSDPIFGLNDIDLQKRLQYMSRGYHVYLKRVNSLDDAINIVRKIKKYHKIGHLEIGGHGTATSIKWPYQLIKVNENRDKLKTLFDMLEPTAAIFTISCYNGKKIKGDNILDYFSKIAPGHKVIGTSCANGKHLHLKISSANPFIIEYTTSRGRNVTVTKYLAK